MPSEAQIQAAARAIFEAHGGDFEKRGTIYGPSGEWRQAVRAAEAALAAAEVKPEGWHPIETAPKDETRVFLNTPWGVVIGYWHDGGPQSDCGRAIQYAGWESEGGETQPGHNMGGPAYEGQQCPPTHWMPLPAPPVLSALEGE